MYSLPFPSHFTAGFISKLLHLQIQIAHISDNSIVSLITLCLIVLVSRESDGRIKIYNHHIVCDNVLDKLLVWFMLLFLCQKSLLMRVVALSSKLVTMLGKTTLQRLICTLLECAVNALSLIGTG